MCKDRNGTAIKIRRKTIHVDTCLVEDILRLNAEGIKTVASCCGHGVYPKTIFYEWRGWTSTEEVAEWGGTVTTLKYPVQYIDYCSGVIVIPDKRKKLVFYIRDAKGYYFSNILESMKRNTLSTLYSLLSTLKPEDFEPEKQDLDAFFDHLGRGGE